MKLSIITINYNNAEGLRKTLVSVASQTYADIEHIIVDGGSTDGSVEVVEAYSQPLLEGKGACSENNYPSQNPLHRVIWISEKDSGIYNAMNKGIEIALGRRNVNADHTSEPLSQDFQHSTYDIQQKSDYIQILNSGDTLAAPDVTERMMAALAAQCAERSSADALVYGVECIGIENGKAELSYSNLENYPAIFYGNMIKEYPDGRRAKDTCGFAEYTPKSFLYFYKGTLNHDCAYIRRNLFEKYDLYNENMKICSDWEWYVRAIVLGEEKTVYTNIDVTIFDMTGISESNGKNKELIFKERREYLKSIIPQTILLDYDMYSLPILQYQRLKKYHLWGIVHFVERVLFKLERIFKR